MISSRFLFGITFSLFLFSCKSNLITKEEKPNIILIMADDMGYECLGAYGSTEYSTPNLNKLAEHGILFQNCISQPLCTPSRVKIMTGKYNYENYDYFGHLGSNERTFAHLMKEAGYTTCIAGKWQLNGLAYKENILDWDDSNKPHRLGFEEYCLWQLTNTRKQGERYSNPMIEQNGKMLSLTEEDYGPDVFSDFVVDFIERKKEQPFFIYYPMVLVHDPFVPTPDCEEWKYKDQRYESDTSYFAEMMRYTDKIVGKIITKIEEVGLSEETYIIFTADNGTHRSIHSKIGNKEIEGGKGKTIDAGIHVPLIIYKKNLISMSTEVTSLIEFSDFYSTFGEIAGIETESKGYSFYPLLSGQEYEPRKTIFVHYDPRWGDFGNKHRNQFVQTVNYKLYRDGNFFNLKNDVLEMYPIDYSLLTPEEIEIKSNLENELSRHPKLK